MGLLGKGALVIWHDLASEGEARFGPWHSHEHMPERVLVPGFLRGHRYRAISGGPKYFVLYEVDALDTLVSRPYLDRLADPTPGTRAALAHFRNVNRTLCRVGASLGVGRGGFALTVRLMPARGRRDALRGWLAERVLPELVERPGLVGAHLLEGDEAASRTETGEKAIRGQADAIADWVVLVEGYEAEAPAALWNGALSGAVLIEAGARPEPAAGLYQAVHSVGAADLAT